jgi:hypothetical protein
VKEETVAGETVASESLSIELICQSGHHSFHNRDRVRRRNDAWCGTCGADLKCDAAVLAAAGEVLDLRKPAASAPSGRLKVAG